MSTANECGGADAALHDGSCPVLTSQYLTWSKHIPGPRASFAPQQSMYQPRKAFVYSKRLSGGFECAELRVGTDAEDGR
jgi:hypothetical protein